MHATGTGSRCAVQLPFLAVAKAAAENIAISVMSYVYSAQLWPVVGTPSTGLRLEQ